MSAAILQNVRRPQWDLLYKGVPLTSRITPMTTSITYTSHEGGTSPDLEIELEDSDKRWQGPWFPQRGDGVSLQIGYVGETMVDCGEFQVDEVELTGPPDHVHIKCLAAYITDAVRTPNSMGWENTTLLAIATTVATKYGFTIVGDPAAINVEFQRQTQMQETDLGFLHRIAQKNKYDFKIQGAQMVFYSIDALEAQAPVISIARGQYPIAKYSFKAVTHEIYQDATASYFDPVQKQLISVTAPWSTAVPTGDHMKISDRCENASDAMQKAAAALHQANSLMATGSMTLEGSTKLAGGSNVAVSGFGQFDGTYMITEARHRIERSSGYTAEIELRQLPPS